MLISIDHGNKQIKTIHKTFTSGLCESDTRPPFGRDVLSYNGKYYTLSDQRIPYMRDKTTDERFFILTLFAIGFELRRMLPSEKTVSIQLCVGLPPAHYGTLYRKFEQYFLDRGILDFQLDEETFSVHITEAECFPQAYAAVMPVFQNLRQMPKAVIVDIGGFTADYLQIKHGEVDLSVCDSLENGVIVLYSSRSLPARSSMKSCACSRTIWQTGSTYSCVLSIRIASISDSSSNISKSVQQNWPGSFCG